jgi:hypothetical protein
LLGYHLIDTARSLPESFKALTSAEIGTAKTPKDQRAEATNKLSVASVNPNNNKTNYKVDNYIPVVKPIITKQQNTFNNDVTDLVNEQTEITTQPIVIAYNREIFNNKVEPLQSNDHSIEANIALEKEIIIPAETINAKSEIIPATDAEIEKAVTKIAKAKNSKVDLQLYFTPTVSYRKLSENKTFASSQPNAPNNLNVLYDINSLVTHKPNIGLELGYTIKYEVDKNIKLKGGLQFNINRYDIKAFNNMTELATISLNNSGSSSINAATSYRSYGSNENTNWLENMYFQASVPLGAEVKLYSSQNVHFGIASTMQPTYIIGDRAYLISSDYKNYVEVPWLIRRWNVNTALETFVGYSTGKLNWQVGPQVRYQMFSSFINKYPVKENLFDFGLKVGISLNK